MLRDAVNRDEHLAHGGDEGHLRELTACLRALVVAAEPWITRDARERRHIERARRFLMTLGRSVGEFIRGTDFLFPCVLTLHKAAESLLRQCGRRGYQFLFFGRLAGDDPPLFLFLEGNRSP